MAKRVYEDEFKRSAVKLAEEQGARNAADELDIPLSTLNNWIRSHKYDNDDIADAAYDSEDIEEEEVFADEPAECEEISDAEDIVSDECDAAEEEAEILLPDMNMGVISCGDSDELYDEMCLTGEVKNYYFVDYENVNHAGLAGFERLTDGDCLRIYYGDKAQTIPFSYIRKLEHTSARIEFTKVLLSIKNGADCQILFEILQAYKHSKQTNFYIISKDTDFDKPIADFKRFGLNIKKIKKLADAYIADKTAEKADAVKKSAVPLTREEQIKSIFNSKLNKAPFVNYKAQILNLLYSSTDKQTLNNALTKMLPGDRIKVIYEAYKDVIKDLDPTPAENPVIQESGIWSDDVRSLYRAHFDSGIYKEKEEEILKIITDSATRQEINMSLCRLIPGKNVSQIFKELKPLLKNIPEK